MTRRSTTFSLAGILLLGCLTFPLTSLAQSEFWTGSRTLFGTDPHLSEARHALERGHDARALRYARNVLRHSVRSHDRMNSYSILCIVYRERGELEASLQACDHALRLMRGDNWQVHANRAQTLLHLGRQQDGMQSIRTAIALLKAETRRPWRSLEKKRSRLASLEAQFQQVGQRLPTQLPTAQASASLHR